MFLLRSRQVAPVATSKHGTSADYTLRRLKRDRPDLAAKAISGELSTHRAAVIASFRKEPLQLNRDPSKADLKLIEELGREAAAKLAESTIEICQRTLDAARG